MWKRIRSHCPDRQKSSQPQTCFPTHLRTRRRVFVPVHAGSPWVKTRGVPKRRGCSAQRFRFPPEFPNGDSQAGPLRRHPKSWSAESRKVSRRIRGTPTWSDSRDASHPCCAFLLERDTRQLQVAVLVPGSSHEEPAANRIYRNRRHHRSSDAAYYFCRHVLTHSICAVRGKQSIGWTEIELVACGQAAGVAGERGRVARDVGEMRDRDRARAPRSAAPAGPRAADRPARSTSFRPRDGAKFLGSANGGIGLAPFHVRQRQPVRVAQRARIVVDGDHLLEAVRDRLGEEAAAAITLQQHRAAARAATPRPVPAACRAANGSPGKSRSPARSSRAGSSGRRRDGAPAAGPVRAFTSGRAIRHSRMSTNSRPSTPRKPTRPFSACTVIRLR